MSEKVCPICRAGTLRLVSKTPIAVEGRIVSVSLRRCTRCDFVGHFDTDSELAAVGGWTDWVSSAESVGKLFLGGPRAVIAEAKIGEVALVYGKIVSIAAPLEAPLTGRSAVAYRLYCKSLLAQQVFPPLDAIRVTEFAVQDETGVARVVTVPQRVQIVTDVEKRRAGKDKQLDPILVAHGFELRDYFLTPHVVAVREGALTPGDAVAVVGLVESPGHDVASGYREQPVRATLVPHPDHFIHVIDARGWVG